MSVGDPERANLRQVIEEVSRETAEGIIADASDEIAAAVAEHLDPLEPLTPEEGVERFINIKSKDRDNIDQVETKLGFFLEYLCDELGIENLNNLTPRQMSRYNEWRRHQSNDRDEPISKNTLEDDMYLINEFIKYMVTIRAVAGTVLTAIRFPNLDEGDGICSKKLIPERADKVLSYLHKYEYAGVEHVTLLLFCKTGRRPCDLRALDVVDFEVQDEKGVLKFRHRPETGTPLKEDAEHEADVELDIKTAQVILDYLDTQRDEITDKHGREPLLTSKHGRLAKETMKKYANKWTRPGAIGEDPDGHDVENCPGMESNNDAYKCSMSRAPRHIRTGYITSKKNEVDPEDLGYRVGATPRVIRKHYDHPDRDEEKERHSGEVRGTGDAGYSN